MSNFEQLNQPSSKPPGEFDPIDIPNVHTKPRREGEFDPIDIHDVHTKPRREGEFDLVYIPNQ